MVIESAHRRGAEWRDHDSEHGSGFKPRLGDVSTHRRDRLRAWGGRIRTRKCHFNKCYLKCRANSLTFRDIFAPETFRGEPERAGCRVTPGPGPASSLIFHERSVIPTRPATQSGSSKPQGEMLGK